MSGLSLALLMASNENDDHDNINSTSHNHKDNVDHHDAMKKYHRWYIDHNNHPDHHPIQRLLPQNNKERT
jgi:hypothetical protein